jgi:predicted ATPase/signal transduction histidine kinase
MAVSPKVTLQTILYEDKKTLVYRSIYNEDLRPALLKSLTLKYSNSRDFQNLKHEFNMALKLDSPATLKPIRLETYDDDLTIVFEDFDAVSLRSILDGPMETGLFLRVSLSITEALTEIHQRSVVHKDIKPENILLNTMSKQVKLMGLGNASFLPRIQAAETDIQKIEGSLPYMSPEQTGRMNRSVDYRSDLYSLGIIFYEMLTGHHPFTATDVHAWVYNHTARTPPPPKALIPEIPPVISDIIMKLLSKTPEDRYQSARGLTFDLTKCSNRWSDRSSVESFTLATHDTLGILQIPEKLYGREREVTEMLKTFERVISTSNPELILISGPSGVGKTRLTKELSQPILKENGFLARSKAEFPLQTAPYSTIAPAFRELTLSILTQSEATIFDWKNKIQLALGDHGQAIINIIPQLELIIGKQPLLPDLPLNQAKVRFHTIFHRFLNVFCHQDHPLVLFLDDLQWADSASLELLQDIVSRPDSSFLLFVGTYRSNEVKSTDPLMTIINGIKKSDIRIQEMNLLSFHLQDLSQLLADTFHCSTDSTIELAQLIHTKTAGNPFFSIEFLKTLNQDGLLKWDRKNQLWSWDIEKIKSQSYTDNVVELMLDKLKQLPKPTQDFMIMAASIGSLPENTTLSLLTHQSLGQIDEILMPAIKEGLMEKKENHFHFLHDRIQQAVSLLLPEKNKPEIHLKIGRALLKDTPKNKLQDRLFEIVRHYLLGSSLLSDSEEALEVAQLCLQSGQTAKRSTAYGSAVEFFHFGMSLLSQHLKESWLEHYALTYSLHYERAECEWLIGNFKECEHILSILQSQAQKLSEKLLLCSLNAKLKVNQGKYYQAVETGLAGLRLTGKQWNIHPTQEITLETFNQVYEKLKARKITALSEIPPLTDTDIQAEMEVCSQISDVASQTDLNLLVILNLHVVDLTLRYGMGVKSPQAFVTISIFLGTSLGRIEEAYRLSQSTYDLVVGNSKFSSSQTKLCYVFGNYIQPWVLPFRACIETVNTGIRTSAENGDLLFGVYCISGKTEFLYASGEPLESFFSEINSLLSYTSRAKFKEITLKLTAFHHWVEVLFGVSPTFSTDEYIEPRSREQTLFEEEIEKNTTPSNTFSYYTLKSHVLIIFGEYDQVIAIEKKLKNLLKTVLLTQTNKLRFYFFASLSFAAQINVELSVDKKEYYKSTLYEYLKKLQSTAAYSQANFGSNLALVEAEVARLEGRNTDAMRLYENAINLANSSGLIQNEALAYETAARYYRTQHLNRIADSYIQNASACYQRWGAQAKVKQLQRTHLILANKNPNPASTEFVSSLERLDFFSVVRASQAISEEIETENLKRKLMQIIIEYTGVQRGCLVTFSVNPPGEPRIEVEGKLGEKGIDITLQPPENRVSIPRSIFRYVERTKEIVLLDYAHEPGGLGKFSSDDYFKQNHPRSALCLPILRQGNLVSLIYLENYNSPGAFTTDRLNILEVLTSQSAISLENAQLLSEAKRAIQVRDDFMTIASHELRTPLTPLRMQLQFLVNTLNTEEFTKEPKFQNLLKLLHNSDKNVLSLMNLVEDLLDVSRMSSGGMTLTLKPVELTQLVRQVLEKFVLQNKEIQYEFNSLTADPIIGYWDPLRIEQTIVNLLKNAVKYGKKEPFQVKIWEKSERAFISVQDFGIGISEQAQLKVFDRFERAVPVEHFGGLGVGLYIARENIMAHQGTIHLKSKLGQGSTFTIELPLKPNKIL